MDKRINFSPHEIERLLNIIKKYSSLIECKKTDAISNERKKQAWDKICMEYNMVTNVIKRSAQQLRFKYKNYKKLSQQRADPGQIEHLKAIDGSKNQNMDQEFCEILIKTEPISPSDDGGLVSETTSTLQEPVTIPMTAASNGNAIETETNIMLGSHLLTKEKTNETLLATPAAQNIPAHTRKTGFARKGSASMIAANHISEGVRARKRALEKEHTENISLKKELHLAMLESIRKKDKRKEEEHVAKMENLERENERNQLEHELRVEAIKSEMNAKIAYYEYLKKQ